MPEAGNANAAEWVVAAQGQPVPETPVTFFRAAEPSNGWRQSLTYADQDPKAPGTPLGIDDELGENFAKGSGKWNGQRNHPGKRGDAQRRENQQRPARQRDYDEPGPRKQ